MKSIKDIQAYLKNYYDMVWFPLIFSFTCKILQDFVMPLFKYHHKIIVSEIFKQKEYRALGAKGNRKPLPMELIKNNTRVLILVVLLMMSTTLLTCDAAGRNKGTINTLYRTNFIYDHTLVIQKISCSAICTSYARFYQRGCWYTLLLAEPAVMEDICTPFQYCRPIRLPGDNLECQRFCDEKNFNGKLSYCSDTYCCCAIKPGKWAILCTIVCQLISLCLKWMSVNLVSTVLGSSRNF